MPGRVNKIETIAYKNQTIERIPQQLSASISQQKLSHRQMETKIFWYTHVKNKPHFH